jgi:hypothetical protein
MRALRLFGFEAVRIDETLADGVEDGLGSVVDVKLLVDV